MKPMRRSKQALDLTACQEVLENGSECVLALAGSDSTDGFPYAVPLNYVYVPPSDAEKGAGLAGHLLMHCAPTGAKLDAIASDARVSACVIDQRTIVPEKLTTYFRSVIAFGRARLLVDDEGRRAALLALAKKFAPEMAAADVDAEIARFFPRTAILDVTLEHVTGKRAIELV